MTLVKASINCQALTHNLARVKQLAPQSQVISVIKANAYGHGLLAVAQALNESDFFAVARLDEACYLRDQGIQKDILLLEGVYSLNDYHRCKQLQLTPVIHCLEQFHCLQDYHTQNNQLNYWLKCDTGMHRLGLSTDEFIYIIDCLQKNKTKFMLNGLMSHFSCADEIGNPINTKQLLQFERLYESLIKNNPSIKKSMANSAAILSFPESHFNCIRPGVMLYGVSPFESSIEGRTGLDEQLLPVMTLSSHIIATKKLKKGDCIGYGASWCCPHDMTIGIVAIGYGDGYPRHAKSGTPVLIHNIEVPLVGRVSMDMISIDLTLVEKKSIPINIGDQVILWGEGLPIEKVSQQSDTIAYELLCQITQRVSFHYD